MWQFSLQKGAKPTLKKSESLFHKERIDLVFKKVKRAFVLVALYLQGDKSERGKSEFQPWLALMSLKFLTFVTFERNISVTKLSLINLCSPAHNLLMIHKETSKKWKRKISNCAGEGWVDVKDGGIWNPDSELCRKGLGGCERSWFRIWCSS